MKALDAGKVTLWAKIASTEAADSVEVEDLETPGEVPAVRCQDGTAKGIVILIVRERLGQLAEHPQVEGISFLGSIQDDDKDMAVGLGADSGSVGVGHGRSIPGPCVELSRQRCPALSGGLG